MENKYDDKKLAVYYVSIGDSALECFYYSYLSLRKSGYLGDVYVITDKNKINYDIDKNTFIRKISSRDLNLDLHSKKDLAHFDVRRLNMKNPRNKKMYEKFTICHIKSLVKNYVPISSYDRIIYFDSDILINKKFYLLKNYLFDNDDKIITAKNRTRFLGEWPLFVSPMWFKYGTLTSNLNKWELFKYWHTQPLCADVISFPSNEMGNSFINVWNSECQKGVDSDQAALQAIILRFFNKEHLLSSHEVFGYGPAAKFYKGHIQKKDSIVVHFHGAVYNNDAMVDYYNKYIK